MTGFPRTPGRGEVDERGIGGPMSDKEQKIIVAATVADCPMPCEPSTQDHCCLCGAKVWVSFSGMNYAGPDAKVVCMWCGIRQMKEDPEANLAPMSEAQARVIRRSTGKDPKEIEEIFRRFVAHSPDSET